MSAASLNTANVALYCDGQDVNGIVIPSHRGLLFVPDEAAIPGASPLPAGGDCTFFVNSGVKDAAGNTMASDWSVSFATAPEPTNHWTTAALVPADGATGLQKRAQVKATFSRPVDPATVNTRTLSVVEFSTGWPAAGTVQTSGDGSLVTWTPSADLAYGAVYLATASGEIRDTNGSPILPAMSLFETTSEILADADGDGIGDITEKLFESDQYGFTTSITLKNKKTLIVNQPIISPDLILTLEDTILTLPTPRLGVVQRLTLVLKKLEIKSVDNTRIDVSGKGYLGGRSEDNPEFRGEIQSPHEGAAQGIDGGSCYPTAGRHGGMGGTRTCEDSPAAPARAYDDYANPTFPGAGAGAKLLDGLSYAGGNGGGVIWITANELIINGSIVADGAVNNGGSGAGGSIKITMTGANSNISGSGLITANGGTNNTVGGGGGLIAIYHDTMSLPRANVRASGGRGSSSAGPNYCGGAGTIYFKNIATQAFGDLVIDNLGYIPRVNSTVLRSVGRGPAFTAQAPNWSIVGNVLTNNVASFPVPDAQSGALGLTNLYLMPVEAVNGAVFRITDNTEKTITFDGVPSVTLVEGNHYVGVHRLDGLTLKRGAQVLTRDVFNITGSPSIDGTSTLHDANLGGQ
jgi:hypothetical protein